MNDVLKMKLVAKLDVATSKSSSVGRNGNTALSLASLKSTRASNVLSATSGKLETRVQAIEMRLRDFRAELKR